VSRTVKIAIQPISRLRSPAVAGGEVLADAGLFLFVDFVEVVDRL
jgi:hypothetical protein